MPSSRDARDLARLLRAVATMIETKPELAAELSMQLDGPDPESRPRRPRAQPPDIDPYSLLREGGPERLRAVLLALNIEELKALVKARGLDSARLVHKWKDREKIVDFVVQRLTSRADVGVAFRDTPPSTG